MKILKIQALRGPNIWSVQRKKLIQMRLDLEDMELFPTNKIEVPISPDQLLTEIKKSYI